MQSKMYFAASIVDISFHPRAGEVNAGKRQADDAKSKHLHAEKQHGKVPSGSVAFFCPCCFRAWF